MTAEATSYSLAEEARYRRNRENMEDAQIPNEEELTLEAQMFDFLGLDNMSHADLTLKDGTHVKYFPSSDGLNRSLNVRGEGFDITIGRWRDLSASSPWVLEGPFAHFKQLNDQGQEVMEYVGTLASPLVKAEFDRLFPTPQSEA